jgi:hypothetical protein
MVDNRVGMIMPDLHSLSFCHFDRSEKSHTPVMPTPNEMIKNLSVNNSYLSPAYDG